jgi:hypothetical protein
LAIAVHEKEKRLTFVVFKNQRLDDHVLIDTKRLCRDLGAPVLFIGVKMQLKRDSVLLQYSNRSRRGKFLLGHRSTLALAAILRIAWTTGRTVTGIGKEWRWLWPS